MFLVEVLGMLEIVKGWGWAGLRKQSADNPSENDAWICSQKI